MHQQQSIVSHGIGNSGKQQSRADNNLKPLQTSVSESIAARFFQIGTCQLVGSSPQMEFVARIAARIACTAHPVIICGETGTGKELIARAIHNGGAFARKPFITVDCGSLVPSLVESELFGHSEGAFTGASQAKEGLLTSANGGTVFLDEIGELPLALQSVLLRALQEKEVRPVGATRTVPFTARVLAATNRDLWGMVKLGLFRKDLYYRLNVLTLCVPPLREREGDIKLLLAHFLRLNLRGIESNSCFSEEAIEILTAYSWPGNVRELKNVVDCSLTLSEGSPITVEDLPAQIRAVHTDNLESGMSMKGRSTAVGLEGSERLGITCIADIERKAIVDAMSQLNGDKLMAAQLLGLSKTTLYRKLKEYGLNSAAHGRDLPPENSTS